MKVGANERCPCGSGKKFKRCCGDRSADTGYTREERAAAFMALDAWIHVFAADEQASAHTEFWGRFASYADQLPPDLAAASQAAEDVWFAFDDCGDRGFPLVDTFLAEAELTSGERAFLTALRKSSTRLYEIVDAVPGRSLTLRDAVEGGVITVNERQGSRTMARHSYVAARVLPRGHTGGPEMDAGILHIPALVKDSALARLRELRARHLDEHRGENLEPFYKTMAPFFHDVWAGSFLEASVPELRTTDSEEMIATTVRFDISDGDALVRALDQHAELERGHEEGSERWLWSGPNRAGKPTVFGNLVRQGDRLMLETNSVERAARGRALLEAMNGGALVKHRITSHENLRKALQERVRAKYLSGNADVEEDEPPRGALPPELNEPLVLGYYATHYRAWIDEAVPALDGATPRQAAADPARRARVVELIQGLVASYQHALRYRQPAYDPSWMWAELGLVDHDAIQHPPPMVHERVAQTIEGSSELAASVAARLRGAAGFDETTTVLSADDEAVDLEIQRFVRSRGAAAAPYLRLMVDFELYRRKTFWVAESLAYMLDQTELDVVGREFRVPFAVFTLVFTDRHVLALAERLLAAAGDSPLAGHLLRVATVQIVQRQRGAARELELCFALDALGEDLPALVRHVIPLADDLPVQAYLDAIAPLPAIDPPPPDTSPIRGLLRTTINAILYATSASVELERRTPPAPSSPRRSGAPPVCSSDEVYFLPGTIDISRVRKLQELERMPEGRALVRRHMVRGHWRRAVKTWTDQRLRWIEPHWKGPDMAAIIEHAYRLKP
jgi:SEC-C motif